MKSILFVCIENSCRSQMAEGFARAIADFPMCVASAGTRPALRVDQGAVEVMRELGIDISRQVPKPIDLKAVENYDYVITMGCGADGICPASFLGVSDDWKIPDPKGKGIEEFRRVRDLIRTKVDALINILLNVPSDEFILHAER
ncbi:MAG TPA: arsenate reductase ArsC [Candidatus Acetothermia bacterium]|nr:arsenate reductase ArsC [Candidatus Acetothermia bacterium]